MKQKFILFSPWLLKSPDYISEYTQLSGLRVQISVFRE